MLALDLGVYFWFGSERALEFLTGYDSIPAILAITTDPFIESAGRFDAMTELRP